DDEDSLCSLFDFEYGIHREQDCASDVCFLRKHCSCSCTQNVRCAARSLASCHLLGPEIPAFFSFIERGKKKLKFDDEDSLCSVFGIEYGIHREQDCASDVCFLRKHCSCSRTQNVRCAARSLASCRLLRPEGPAFFSFIEVGWKIT